jgi:hypothetical protein
VTSPFFESFAFGAAVKVQRREVRWCLRVVVCDFGRVGAEVVVPEGTEAPPVPPFGFVGACVAAGGTGDGAAVEVVGVAVVGGGVVGAGVGGLGAAVVVVGVVVAGGGVVVAGGVVVGVVVVVVVVVLVVAALVSGVVVGAAWPVDVVVAAVPLGTVSATAAVAGMDATATPAANAAAWRRTRTVRSAAEPRSAPTITASDFGTGRPTATPSAALNMNCASGSSTTSSGTGNRARQSKDPATTPATAPGVGRPPSARKRCVQLRKAG